MSGRYATAKPHRTAARRCGAVLSGAVGALAAAAVATGSAAPAQADFDDLLDPIVQPLITSLTDSIAIFDPAAALDLSTWANGVLDSLGSLDFATTSVAEPASALAAATNALADPPPLPITMLEGTEPAVYATINSGDSVPLLVDTGSAGLVVPYTDLGDNYFSQLQSLFELGLPTGIASSGYSGGVDYVYLTYNSVPVDYLSGNGGDVLLSTDGPVNIEVYSFAPGNLLSYFTNDAFQNFLDSNEVDGILGIGYNASGPEVSPFINYGGVLVDLVGADKHLDIGAYDPPANWVSTLGAPISSSLESVNNGTAATVSNNFDSGGVFGTIPSSLATGTPVGSTLPDGVLITAKNTAGEVLYSYTTGQFDISDIGEPAKLVSDGPVVISGTGIDSGVIPFFNHEVYLDYSGTAGVTYFSPFLSS